MQIEECLGEVMIFNIISAVQEHINEKKDDIKLKAEEEKAKKEKEEKEAEQVTKFSFKINFFFLYIYKNKGGCLKRAHLANTHSQGFFINISPPL